MAETPSVVLDGKIEVRALTSYTGPGLTSMQWSAGKDITADLLGDGLSRDTTENAVSIDRLSYQQVGEAPGTTLETVELTYAWNPQSNSVDSAYATLSPGTVVALAIRYGVNHGASGSTGEKVDIIEVTCGAQRRVPVARNEESRVVQRMFVKPGGTQFDVEINGSSSSSSSSS